MPRASRRWLRFKSRYSISRPAKLRSVFRDIQRIWHFRMADQTARWYCTPQRSLRIVAVDPLSGGRGVQAFYSTKHEATAEQVLSYYARRWAVEQTFQETKSHLGFEQSQGWTRRAVERTAPTAMLIYALEVKPLAL